MTEDRGQRCPLVRSESSSGLQNKTGPVRPGRSNLGRDRAALVSLSSTSSRLGGQRTEDGRQRTEDPPFSVVRLLTSARPPAGPVAQVVRAHP